MGRQAATLSLSAETIMRVLALGLLPVMVSLVYSAMTTMCGSDQRIILVQNSPFLLLNDDTLCLISSFLVDYCDFAQICVQTSKLPLKRRFKVDALARFSQIEYAGGLPSLYELRFMSRNYDRIKLMTMEDGANELLECSKCIEWLKYHKIYLIQSYPDILLKLLFLRWKPSRSFCSDLENELEEILKFYTGRRERRMICKLFVEKYLARAREVAVDAATADSVRLTKQSLLITISSYFDKTEDLISISPFANASVVTGIMMNFWMPVLDGLGNEVDRNLCSSFTETPIKATTELTPQIYQRNIEIISYIGMINDDQTELLLTLNSIKFAAITKDDLPVIEAELLKQWRKFKERDSKSVVMILFCLLQRYDQYSMWLQLYKDSEDDRHTWDLRRLIVLLFNGEGFPVNGPMFVEFISIEDSKYTNIGTFSAVFAKFLPMALSSDDAGLCSHAKLLASTAFSMICAQHPEDDRDHLLTKKSFSNIIIENYIPYMSDEELMMAVELAVTLGLNVVKKCTPMAQILRLQRLGVLERVMQHEDDSLWSHVQRMLVHKE